MKTRSLVLLLVLLTATLGAQAPDRSKPPVPGPAPSVKIPAIQKRQLTNGLPVWIVEMHKVPVVQVDLVVPSGSADDPTGKYGIASLTAAMLINGAGTHSALDLADAVDFLGADLGTNSGTDASEVRLHVPVARLAEALPIMGDVSLRPTFPADELERQRRQRLTAIIQARDNPTNIDAVAFSRVLYGPTNRYGTTTGGTAVSLAGLAVADLKTYYESNYQPANATLLVVGDVKMDTVLPALEARFGGWKPQVASSALVQQAAAPAVAARTIYIIDKPGAPQSQIRIGSIGVARSTPDYFPLEVLNTVLGGSFSSRLNMNLREKNGFTYGASSVFDMRLGAGPFVAAAGVQTDKTAPALKEFFNELNGILQPVPADELSRAKNYIALQYPGEFETTGDISRRLEDAVVYHLPDDYFDKYVQNIQSVTAADVQRVAQKYLQPTKMAVVITGDRKAIEAPIRALNLAPIKILTIDDVFGPAPSVGRASDR